MMRNHKQNNPRWNRLKIRGTNLRIGQYGCLICCIASLSTYFGQGTSPIGIIDLTGFTADGRLIWRSGAYPDFEFYKIIKGRDDIAIEQALHDENRAVILGLNGGKHWVVACAKLENPDAYMIADPLGKSDRSILSERDEISYMAFFKRK